MHSTHDAISQLSFSSQVKLKKKKSRKLFFFSKENPFTKGFLSVKQCICRERHIRFTRMFFNVSNFIKINFTTWYTRTQPSILENLLLVPTPYKIIQFPILEWNCPPPKFNSGSWVPLPICCSKERNRISVPMACFFAVRNRY